MGSDGSELVFTVGTAAVRCGLAGDEMDISIGDDHHAWFSLDDVRLISERFAEMLKEMEAACEE